MMNEVNTKLIENFNSRNIDVEFFNTLDEVRDKILDIIPLNKTVGIGNSQTLKKLNVSKALSERGNIVYDKTLASTKEEVRLLKKKSLLTDWYITGTNAISAKGHIVNIDHSGNRVAAMTYGPDKVIIVVGKNKIEEDLEQAIHRARNYAAPRNAIRAGYNPPCLEAKKCVDCKSKDRVCYILSIIEGQHETNRMTLFIVDEEAGF